MTMDQAFLVTFATIGFMNYINRTMAKTFEIYDGSFKNTGEAIDEFKNREFGRYEKNKWIIIKVEKI
jgi:hypothetical protein